MRGNFRFKMNNQDKIYRAICNPFVGGYIITETEEVLTSIEIEEMIKSGDIVIIN